MTADHNPDRYASLHNTRINTQKWLTIFHSLNIHVADDGTVKKVTHG